MAFCQPGGGPRATRIGTHSALLARQLSSLEAIAAEAPRRSRLARTLRCKATMLRILRNDRDSHRVVLMLQGRIGGEWAGLLERECLESSRSGLRVAIDLAEVTFIGRSGLETLGRLSRAGVEIIGCSPLIAEMLEQEGIDVGANLDDDLSP